jgi:hypothetical protein
MNLAKGGQAVDFGQQAAGSPIFIGLIERLASTIADNRLMGKK